jgi:hypothetical protein
MNLKPLYIIFVIAIFNFILINIFRLQNEITDIRNKKKKVDDIMKISKKSSKEKKTVEGNICGDIISPKIKNVMNELAELVPIDFNKIDISKDKFMSFEEQVKLINS